MTTPSLSHASTWLRTRTDAQLAGGAVALSALWLVSLVFVFGTPEPLRVALTVLGSVLAPALATVVFVRLAAGPLGLSVRRRRILLAVTVFAFLALALTANSFSVGFDDADAGRPSGLFASLTAVFAVASVLAFAASIALVLVAAIGERLSTRASVAIAVLAGLVAAPFVAVTFLTPAPSLVYSLAAFVWAVWPAALPKRVAQQGVRPLVAVESVRDRVILLAAVSLATTLVVWVGGISLSIANTGTDAATTGLGVASALGQLAVIPLLWAVSLLFAVRMPASTATARLGLAVASATVAGAALAMTVGYSPQGGLFIPLIALLSLGVGFWAASVVWALTASWPSPARAATAAVALVATALLYAVVVALSGGVALALASGFLAFGGARLLLRQRRPVGEAG